MEKFNVGTLYYLLILIIIWAAGCSQQVYVPAKTTISTYDSDGRPLQIVEQEGYHIGGK